MDIQGRNLLERKSEKSPTYGNLESSFDIQTDQIS